MKRHNQCPMIPYLAAYLRNAGLEANKRARWY